MKTELTIGKLAQELQTYSKFKLTASDILSPLYFEAEFQSAAVFGTYSPSILLTGNGLRACLYHVRSAKKYNVNGQISFEVSCCNLAEVNGNPDATLPFTLLVS